MIEADHGSFISGFIPDLFSEGNRGALSAEIEILKNRASAISKEALIESQKAMAERSGSIELLAETNLPVLFIIGKQDSRIDFNQVYAQTILPKRSFVLLLENCGHMGYLEAPEDSLAAIEGFLLACNKK
jgi:pimeloyl-ACP methyl ester carboxylesterase